MSLSINSFSQESSDHNISLIFDTIVRYGPTSPVDIAKKTRVDIRIVTYCLDLLLAKNLITEIRTQGEESLVAFRPKTGSILAVDVGGTKMAGAVVNLKGDIEVEKRTPSYGGKEPIESLIDLLAELHSEAVARQLPPLGIGLGVPGVTDAQGQSVTLAPGLGWHDMNVGERLWKVFSLPVWVDNDVNVFLLGEHLKGSMQGVTNGMGITIGTGIGGSFLLNGEIYRGSNGAAGEVGYWTWSTPNGKYSQQTFGEFESFASGTGIARRAKELLLAEPQQGKILRELVQDKLEDITAEDVFAAANLGDKSCANIVEDTAEVLGIVLANLSTVLDVERIVIGGGVASGGEVLLEPIKQIIRQITPYPPEIVQSRLGYRASIIGAAAGFMQRQGHTQQVADLA
ncbi:MAG: ROK family transcriptional regulator [Firmicutes bacterium]|nr:ROK family transcriptional regulator [Bacillota bacterium]